MRWLYQIALHLLGLLAFPYLLYSILIKGKYKKSLRKRLGFDFPFIEKKSRPLIWVHAVSLGETKAIAPLIAKLKAHPRNPMILLTTATETGYEEGQKISVDYHSYLPLDFNYVIGPIVKKVAPDLLLLTETDFWPNLLHSAKKNGAKIVVVNGKLSKRSFTRYSLFRPFAKRLFNLIECFCLQSPIYAQRFLALGVSAEKIAVTGNIKLDNFSKNDNLADFREKLGITEEDLVLTIGSTHDPEEKIVLQALKGLMPKFPKLKVLLVPRHPERFETVERLIERAEMPYTRFSKGCQGEKLILIDAMGQLRKCYELSDLAFVGGSLTAKVGGHNILEPSFYGVPVLFGPYMHNQLDFLDLIKSYDGGEEVSEETLMQTLEKYLFDATLREKMGERGRRLIEESQGALEATYRKVLSCCKWD